MTSKPFFKPSLPWHSAAVWILFSKGLSISAFKVWAPWQHAPEVVESWRGRSVRSSDHWGMLCSSSLSSLWYKSFPSAVHTHHDMLPQHGPKVTGLFVHGSQTRTNTRSQENPVSLWDNPLGNFAIVAEGWLAHAHSDPPGSVHIGSDKDARLQVV